VIELLPARPLIRLANGEALVVPSVNGNKRTSFAVGVLFLELNGYRFTASEEAAAQGCLSRLAGFCEFLRANVGLHK
jgi:hypothetical protein